MYLYLRRYLRLNVCLYLTVYLYLIVFLYLIVYLVHGDATPVKKLSCVFLFWAKRNFLCDERCVRCCCTVLLFQCKDGLLELRAKIEPKLSIPGVSALSGTVLDDERVCLQARIW